MKLRGSCVLAVLGAFLYSCGEPANGCFHPDAGACIALQHDFADFRSWERFALGQMPATAGHPVSGPRYVYLNRRPPPGSREWPVGTMIVKTTETGDPTSWEIHAMVKRGGDYNARGAVGWEYFDLRIGNSGVPVVLWRGPAPPAGGGYQTSTGAADCNGCHATPEALANDAVLNSQLRLSNY